MGFRAWGLGFGVRGLGFEVWVWGSGFEVRGLGLSLGFVDSFSRCRILGFGLRVLGCGVRGLGVGNVGIRTTFKGWPSRSSSVSAWFAFM